MERASVDGILLYDPTYKTAVLSVDGLWEPTRNQPLFEIDYDTAFNVNGAAITTDGAKIPYDVAEIDRASWATFNATTNDFTLSAGRYFISGYVSLSKVSGSGKTFTGYLAETSDLTTPVGTVRMGSLAIPSSASSNETHVVPFSGQVEVPTGGETYAMVVNTPNTNTRFGTAHNISGLTNVYSRLAISLIGLES
jgi:hypothetical protein